MMAIGQATTMAGDMFHHRNAAGGLKPGDASGAKPYNFLRCGAEGAIADHLMRPWKPKIQNRRADHIKPRCPAHGPQKPRIGTLRDFSSAFKSRCSGKGLPMRWLQARYAPAFLINENGCGGAEQPANIIGKRAQLRRAFNVARKQDDA